MQGVHFLKNSKFSGVRDSEFKFSNVCLGFPIVIGANAKVDELVSKIQNNEFFQAEDYDVLAGICFMLAYPGTVCMRLWKLNLSCRNCVPVLRSI